MEENFRRVPPPPPPRPFPPRVDSQVSPAEGQVNSQTDSLQHNSVVQQTAQPIPEQYPPRAEQIQSSKQDENVPEVKGSSKEKLMKGLLIVGCCVAFVGALVCGYFLLF